MFTQSAAFYDLIYSWKNYRQEVDRLLVIIRARVPEAKTILDVACERENICATWLILIGQGSIWIPNCYGLPEENYPMWLSFWPICGHSN